MLNFKQKETMADFKTPLYDSKESAISNKRNFYLVPVLKNEETGDFLVINMVSSVNFNLNMAPQDYDLQYFLKNWEEYTIENMYGDGELATIMKQNPYKLEYENNTDQLGIEHGFVYLVYNVNFGISNRYEFMDNLSLEIKEDLENQHSVIPHGNLADVSYFDIIMRHFLNNGGLDSNLDRGSLHEQLVE